MPATSWAVFGLPRVFFRSPIRRLGGWLALLAFAWSIPATNIGLMIGTIGLLGPHNVEVRVRGQEVLFVLHHRDEALPASSLPAGTGAQCGPDGVGGHETDHELRIPSETDSVRRDGSKMFRSRVSAAQPPTVERPPFFSGWRAAQVPPVRATLPRVGPPGLRTIELRI